MDEFDIPSDFKVRSISDGFSDYEFLYADTLITSIIENVFGTSYTLFYTDGLLDSIKIVLNDSLRTASATSIVYFKRSSKGKIVEINKEQYPLRVRYNKEEQDIEEIEVRQLLRSEYYSYRDSLVYDQEHDLVEMHRHRTGDFPEKVFIRELEKTVNLFWWVSNKLGFPFFNTFVLRDLANTSINLSRRIVKKYDYERGDIKKEGKVTCKFDNQGRPVNIDSFRISYY